MRVPSAILLFSFAALLPQAPAPDASKAAFSTPALVTTIDTGKLKGEPTAFAWSIDSSQWYLETRERSADNSLKNPRHFVMAVSAPHPKAVENPPEWAATYYNWKSGKAAPGTSSPEIEANTSETTATSSESAMGGSSYGGGGVNAVSGTTVEGAARRSEQEMKVRVITLTLKGETVGRFVNEALVPGYTFGWAPPNLGVLAYVNTAGRLAVMDVRGGHQEVPSSKNVILPAWSPDGSTIAYLQRTGKKKFELYTVKIAFDSK